jgi:hypothetical protein
MIVSGSGSKCDQNQPSAIHHACPLAGCFHTNAPPHDPTMARATSENPLEMHHHAEFQNSITPDKLKSADKFKPEHITGFP